MQHADGKSFVCVSFPLSACPKWTFGPGCSEECRCVQQNSLECHRRNGNCVCKSGYRGSTCKEGEHSVYWGVITVQLHTMLFIVTFSSQYLLYFWGKKKKIEKDFTLCSCLAPHFQDQTNKRTFRDTSMSIYLKRSLFTKEQQANNLNLRTWHVCRCTSKNEREEKFVNMLCLMCPEPL